MTVVPGFIDSHCHFYDMGISMIRDVMLRDTPSLEAAMIRLREKAKATKEGEWILGEGWDESKWPENRYPTRRISTLSAGRIHDGGTYLRPLAHSTRQPSKYQVSQEDPQPAGGKVDMGTTVNLPASSETAATSFSTTFHP
jgi:hypothetical protein